MAKHIAFFRLALPLIGYASLSLATLPAVAQLQNSPQTSSESVPEATRSLLSDNCAWGADVVTSDQPQPETSGDTVSGPPITGDTSSDATTGNDAASLAQRVAALEQYIQQQQSATRAESLPPPTKSTAPDNQEATPLTGCVPTKIDTIVKPTFQPMGRITFDGVTYDDDDATKDFFDTDRNNELGFRSIRIGGKGNIYENLIYNIEVELRGTNSAIAYKDIYMEQQSLPYVGHFRVGHFKEPIGLEEFESDLYLTFMDKAPATNSFAPAQLRHDDLGHHRRV